MGKTLVGVITLLSVLKSPSITILLGQRGEGKTATGMKFLEEAHNKGLKCYILGIPRSKWRLLPDYILPVTHMNDIEDSAAVFIDEVYLFAHARETSKKSNRALAKILGVARQKDWTLMFAAHASRKMDYSLVADCNNIMFKRQTLELARFERKQIMEKAMYACGIFYALKKQGKITQARAVIFSEDIQGGVVVINYPLPTFWTDEMSKAFSGLKLSEL